MKPNWSVQNEISKRVQRESVYEWAMNYKGEKIPPIKKCDTIKYNVGWLNFISNVLKELKP